MALRKFLFIDSTEGVSTEQATTDELSLGKLSLLGVGGVAVDAGSNRITNVSDPTSAQDAATKSYVDAASTNSISVVQSLTANEIVSAGDPVAWGSVANKFNKGDASNDADSRIFGIANVAITSNASGNVTRVGIAGGVLVAAVPGTPYFLSSNGGLTTAVPSGTGHRVVRVGYAKNATDLDVVIADLGRRA